MQAGLLSGFIQTKALMYIKCLCINKAWIIHYQMCDMSRKYIILVKADIFKHIFHFVSLKPVGCYIGHIQCKNQYVTDVYTVVLEVMSLHNIVTAGLISLKGFNNIITCLHTKFFYMYYNIRARNKWQKVSKVACIYKNFKD